MKKLFLILAASALLFACGGNSKTKKLTVEEQAVEYAKQLIEAEESGDYDACVELEASMVEWAESLSAEDQEKAERALIKYLLDLEVSEYDDEDDYYDDEDEDWIEDYVEDAYDTAAEYAKDAYDTAAEYAKDAYDTASEYAKDVYDSASDYVDETMDDVSDYVDETLDDVSDLLDDLL